jgi:hypothetical protein
MTGITNASSLDVLAVLPPECGGQGKTAALAIGDAIPVLNGQSNMLQALQACWDHGIRHFVAPMIACGTPCNQSVTVIAFTPIELANRPVATGNPKYLEWSAYCGADGPCGLGVCTPAYGDCSICPEDCGGCTPACP